MSLPIRTWMFCALLSTPVFAKIPAHDQALVNLLQSTSSEAPLEAARALAVRHQQGSVADATEEALRTLFSDPHTAPNTRMAIAFYFGEVIRIGDDDTTWVWLLEHYPQEKDLGVRLILQHALGELAQAENTVNLTPTALERHRRQMRLACHRLLTNPPEPTLPRL